LKANFAQSTIYEDTVQLSVFVFNQFHRFSLRGESNFPEFT